MNNVIFPIYFFQRKNNIFFLIFPVVKDDSQLGVCDIFFEYNYNEIQ